jgi:hypothetical protein
MPLRLERGSVDAFYHHAPGNKRGSAGYLVKKIVQGLAAVADSCVTWLLPDLIARTGLLMTLIAVAEITCAMVLHEKAAESHAGSTIELLCSAVRGLCGCMFQSVFTLQIQSARIHGALFLVFARMMEKDTSAQEKFAPLPVMSVRQGRVYVDSEEYQSLDSCLGFAVADLISGETPSRFFLELLLHGATEQDKSRIIAELESDEDDLNSRCRAAASVRCDGIDTSIHCASVILMFVNCLWSREHVVSCSAGPVILRALTMSQHRLQLPAMLRGAAMKALSLSLKRANSAIIFITNKILNIFPTIFANGFNFPPPAACVAEHALQVTCFCFHRILSLFCLHIHSQISPDRLLSVARFILSTAVTVH